MDARFFTFKRPSGAAQAVGWAPLKGATVNRSDAKQDSSRTVQETARLILRHLRDNEEGASKEALAVKAGVAGVTVQRALKYMREEWDAPLEFVHGSKLWRLLDNSFTLPLTRH